MEPVFFVFAWLAYIVIFWSMLIWLDLHQGASRSQWPNSAGKFLRRLYARGPRFAALLISLLGVAAFGFGFLAGWQRNKQGASHG